MDSVRRVRVLRLLGIAAAIIGLGVGQAAAQATPQDHLFCAERQEGFLMESLNGPALKGGAAPTAWARGWQNTVHERRYVWAYDTGYLYMKVTPSPDTGTGASGGQDSSGPGGRKQINILGYRKSVRTTSSLLSSPGSVQITELLDPAERTPEGVYIRTRFYLLDQHDNEAHTARVDRIANNQVFQAVDLAEGEYVEMLSATKTTSVMWLGPVKKIADLAPDDSARVFLDWAWGNADEQGLAPPSLPWHP